jgi:hypothetical protein
MENTDKLWQDMKEDYLCRVEAALMMTDKASRQNILNDVEEHLDRRYEELAPERKNREQFETIISDMGPAEDYAELLTSRTESHGAEYTPSRGVVFLNRLMVILFLAVLFSVVGWKITTGSVLDRGERSLAFFENDPQLVGKWIAVDFVQHPDAFVLGQKQWPGELFLKKMRFYDNGKTDGPWEWTKGDIYHPGDDSHAKYQVHQIDGEDYLFFEFINGDVLIRGEKPRYFVLKKEK